MSLFFLRNHILFCIFICVSEKVDLEAQVLLLPIY